jgi:hypothetical protein
MIPSTGQATAGIFAGILVSSLNPRMSQLRKGQEAAYCEQINTLFAFNLTN